MEWSTLLSALNSALNRLFELDRHLLECNVSERSISHRLAEHLNHFLPATMTQEDNYCVDCEYNRFGGQTKTLPFNEYVDRKGEHVYAPSPDIIIHKRGPRGENLLVIELKKAIHAGPTWVALDKLKLATFMEPPLKYSYALYLCLGFDADAFISEAQLVTSATYQEVVYEERKQLRHKLEKSWLRMKRGQLGDSLKKEVQHLACQLTFVDVREKTDRPRKLVDPLNTIDDLNQL